MTRLERAMTANELRYLATRLMVACNDIPDVMVVHDITDAAAYLRACADAMEAGPVAWCLRLDNGELQSPSMSERAIEWAANWIAPAPEIVQLYPVAMPAQQQDDPLTRSFGPVRNLVLTRNL